MILLVIPILMSFNSFGDIPSVSGDFLSLSSLFFYSSIRGVNTNCSIHNLASSSSCSVPGRAAVYYTVKPVLKCSFTRSAVFLSFDVTVPLSPSNGHILPFTHCLLLFQANKFVLSCFILGSNIRLEDLIS